MKGMFKPKLILSLMIVIMLVSAGLGFPDHLYAHAAVSTITLNPPSGPANTPVTATGSGFAAGDSVSVLWVPTHTFLNRSVFVVVQSDGTFTASFTIPGDAAPNTTPTIQFRIEDHHPPILVGKPFKVTAVAQPTELTSVNVS